MNRKRKKSKCPQCKKNPLLQESVFKARLEDIPDGEFLTINRCCGECLEKIANEVMECDA